jgi:hypothetical protein
MAFYTVEAPNGKTYDVEGPEGASQQAVIAAVIAQYPESATAAKEKAAEPIQPPELEDPGLLGAPIAGMREAIRSFAKTKEAISGGKPTVSEEEAKNLAAQPFELKDILHPITTTEKALYQLGKMAPELVGAGAGAFTGARLGALGGAAVPVAGETGAGEVVGGGLGGIAGMGVGAGVVSAAKELGPYYAQALKEHPDNPNAAFKLALKQAVAEGAITGTSFALFKLEPFQNNVANLLAQAFAIQPAASAAGTAAQNIIAGKPISEGVAESYVPSVLGTVVPLVGEKIAGAAVRGAARAARGKPEVARETPPEVPSEVPPSVETPPSEAGVTSDEQARASFGRDAELLADYNRLRSMGNPVGVAYDTAVRRAMERTAPAAAATTEVPRGPEPAEERYTGEPRVRGREPSIPAVGGETIAAGPAPAVTGLEGERLGVPREPVEPVRGREAVEPGPLDRYLPPGFETLSPEEQAQELAYAQEARRADEQVAEVSPAAPVAPPAPLVPTLTLDPKTPWVERTAQAKAAVKSVVDTHPDFTGVKIAVGDINKAAQRLVNNNGGDPYTSLSRVLEEEPATLKKTKPKEALPEPEAAPKVEAAPKEEAVPEAAAPEKIAPTEDLFSYAERNPSESPYVPFADQLRTKEPESRLIKKGTPEYEAVTKRAPEARPAQELTSVEERIPDIAEYISGWANRSPVFSPVIERIQPYLRAAARIVAEEPYTPIPDALRRAIPDDVKTGLGRPEVRPDPVREPAPEVKAPEALPAKIEPSVVTTEETAAINDAVKRIYGPRADAAWHAKMFQLWREAQVGTRGEQHVLKLMRGEKEAAQGMYSPLENLIRVALDADNKLKTLHHEAVHAIRGLGLFKDSEWATLSKRAKEEWIDKYNIKEEYKGDKLNDEQLIEEAVAEAFADYIDNKNQGGKTKNLFDRLRNFLRAIVDTVARRPEAVFRRIEKGKVGARERRPVTGGGAEGPLYKGAAEYSKARDAERAQIEAELRDRLNALGLRDVALKVPDWMKVERGEKEVSLQRKEADKAETDISVAQQKFEQSANAYNIGKATEGHDPEAFKGSVRNLAEAADEKTTKVLGRILPTSAITDIMSAKDKDIGNAAVRVIGEADAYSDTKANLNEGIYNLAKPVVKFIRRNGYRVLANMQAIARQNRVNPTAFADINAALAGDEMLKGYDKLISGTTDPRELTDYGQRRARREAQLKETYKLWDELGEQQGGQEAYKILRQFYRDAYDIRRTLRNKLFDAIAGDDPAIRARMDKMRQDAFEKVRVAPDPDYHGIERTLTPEEYSPYMRFGDYWLRVNKGVGGEPEYYHFDSATERMQFQRKRAAELGVGTSDPEIFSIGKGAKEERNSFLNWDGVLREMFTIIDKNPRLSESQREALKDDAFQARLDALPESSLRKHFKHAKERTGWAPDPVRVLEAYAQKFIAETARLQHQETFNRAVEQARKVFEGRPANAETAKLQEYMDAVINRGESAFSPPTTNSLVTLMNRMGFLYFLSGGASAMTQLTGVPMRVFPSIGSTYGYGKATALLGKYMKTWDGLGIRTTLADGTKEWVAPSIGKSSPIKNNPRLLDAFKQGGERRAFSQVPTTTILETGRTPTKLTDELDHRIKSAILKTGSALFSSAETLSREMAYMMRYEAAYDALRQKKVPVPVEEAHARAIDEAVRETENALGNYRETERPSIMKGPVGRTVFLFKMFSVNTTKFFVKNAYEILKGESKEVRGRAAKELAGVLAMGAAFSGVTGLPLYGVVASAIGMLIDQLEDDEDKRRRLEEDPVLAQDYDAYFRYKWLPEHFGTMNVPGTNVPLARVAEIGPISALSGFNFAPRTSYNGLWLREGLAGKNWADSAKNLMMANIGPAVSMGGSLDLAAADFNEGNIERGIERLVPGLVRGPLMAYRLRTEGAETRGGDKIVKPEEIDDMSLAASVLGFSPSVVSDAQQKRFAALNFQQRLNSDKANALHAMNRAMWEQDQDALKRACKKVNDFNEKYPVGFAIDADTLDSSLSAYEDLRMKQIRGVAVKDDELAYYKFLSQ